MKRKTEATEEIVKKNNAAAGRRIRKYLGSWHEHFIIGDESRFLQFAKFAVGDLSTDPWESLWFRRTTGGVGGGRSRRRRNSLGGALPFSSLDGGAEIWSGEDEFVATAMNSRDERKGKRRKTKWQG